MRPRGPKRRRPAVWLDLTLIDKSGAKNNLEELVKIEKEAREKAEAEAKAAAEAKATADAALSEGAEAKGSEVEPAGAGDAADVSNSEPAERFFNGGGEVMSQPFHRPA